MIKRICKISLCVAMILAFAVTSTPVFAVEGVIMPTPPDEGTTEGTTSAIVYPIPPSSTETASTTQEVEGPTTGGVIILGQITTQPSESTTVSQNTSTDNEVGGYVDSEEDLNVNTKPEETTESDLPDGAFYVYLEHNNGDPRRKTLMSQAGRLPTPNTPYRKGFDFAGWYKDEELTQEWNFLTDVAESSFVIYAKWVDNGTATVYNINVAQAEGGVIRTNPESATVGEYIYIRITPDEGKRLVAGSLLINGQQSDVLSFKMPMGEVNISAQFEDIPEEDKIIAEEKDATGIIVGVLSAVFVVAIAFSVIISRKKRKYGADTMERTENDDPEALWVDKSIKVENAFTDGKKKVNEEFTPDFGKPEE